jgi:hypothetical protein
MEHTNFLFSLLFFVFVILSVIAFNFAEGFTRLTGAYIFWYSTLIAIVGVFWKAVIGEPADSNLEAPLLSMALYSSSMVMLLLVTLLNKKIDFRALGIGGGLSKGKINYTAAGLGCLIVALSISLSDLLFGQAPGSIVSILVQVDVFPSLGVILCTIGALQDSDGRRSTTTVSLLAMFIMFFLGVTAFSKQQMLTPPICWLLGVLYMRLRLRIVHYVAIVLIGVISFGFVSPWSACRDLGEDIDNTAGRVAVLIYYLGHWSEFRQHVAGLEESEEQGGVAGYYTKAQGSLLERLNMIYPDDSLFEYTSEGHYEGMAPVQSYVANLAPHFISPNKQNIYGGNYYAHEMGRGLAADDFTTGISYSPVAEAYHCEGWGGIFWLLPLIWIVLFTTVDFVVGDMTKYPWGLMVVVWFAHAAPETLLGGMIYFIGYGNFGMMFAIIVCTRLAPIIGALFSGKPVAGVTRSVRRASPLTPQPQE